MCVGGNDTWHIDNIVHTKHLHPLLDTMLERDGSFTTHITTGLDGPTNQYQNKVILHTVANHLGIYGTTQHGTRYIDSNGGHKSKRIHTQELQLDQNACESTARRKKKKKKNTNKKTQPNSKLQTATYVDGCVSATMRAFLRISNFHCRREV